MTILKTGDASTLDMIVDGEGACFPRSRRHSPQSHDHPLADQSIFVRASINGVVREGAIAAVLTGLMILVFLGSWRSTLIIAISIPLSVLRRIIVLSALGETINIMTLGGLALAVGILVDDATVTIENINRNLDQGKEIVQAILDGAPQIAMPALVSTLSICIVFVPMFFLAGVARYLFVPLAEAVVFAMLASYLLSRTLVPTMARFLLVAQTGETARPKRSFAEPARAHAGGIREGIRRFRERYGVMLESAMRHRTLFVSCFFPVCILSFALLPFLGQDFFPAVEAVNSNCTCGAPPARESKTPRICAVASKTNPQGKSRRSSWPRSSIISACPTAA